MSLLPAICITLPLTLPLLSGSLLQTGQGPGDPLPRFTLRVKGDAEATTGEKGQLTVNGAFELVWGDLKLTGDRFTYNPAKAHLEAFGHVVLQRGDEIIRGENLILDGLTGLLDVQQATAITPPFFFQGSRLQRTPTGLIAYDSVLSLKEGGKGEIAFRAAQIRLLNTDRIVIYNATLYLFNKPLLRVRHLSLPVDIDPSYGGSSGHPSPPPIGFRQSRISGSVLGVGTQWTPLPGFAGSVALEMSSRQGFQYDFALERTLMGPRRSDRPRRLASPPGGIQSAKTGGPPATTPLRQLLTARTPPAPRDPVLDFEDILPSADPFTRPTRTPQRSLLMEARLSGKRELSSSRFGPLLLSRQPEVTLSGTMPLYPSVDLNDNQTARRFLRTPRFSLAGEIVQGRYQEIHLADNSQRVSEQRTSSTFMLGMNPLLLGTSFLINASASVRTSRYSNQTTYGYTEGRLSAAYIFGKQTMLGGSLIQRDTGGRTPFFFDQIDTDNEAQLRGQTTFGKGRFTLAVLERFDLRQGRPFDTEIAFGFRGSVIEPRISYKKLNGNFGFSIAVPGLTTQ